MKELQANHLKEKSCVSVCVFAACVVVCVCVCMYLLKESSQAAAPDFLTQLYFYAQDCTEKNRLMEKKRGIQEYDVFVFV